MNFQDKTYFKAMSCFLWVACSHVSGPWRPPLSSSPLILGYFSRKIWSWHCRWETNSYKGLLDFPWLIVLEWGPRKPFKYSRGINGSLMYFIQRMVGVIHDCLIQGGFYKSLWKFLSIFFIHLESGVYSLFLSTKEHVSYSAWQVPRKLTDDPGCTLRKLKISCWC